jgi:hypothetical protein
MFSRTYNGRGHDRHAKEETMDAKKTDRRSSLIAITGAVAAGCAMLKAPRAAGAEFQKQSPYMMITYQASPKDRPAMWKYAQGPWRERLNAWLKEGRFAEYRLLLNSYVDDYTWDAMLILNFDGYEQVEKWNAVEREFPSGLTGAGLGILTPDHTYLANRPFSRRAPDASPHEGVYFVIPYAYRKEGEYINYAQVYILPQFEGWVDSKIALGYEVFLNRHQTGQQWDSLLIIQYKNTEQFGQRDVLKDGVREGLEKQPAWKLVSDNKHDFRTEWETTIAEPIRP